jgi:hypothetical protein
VPISIQTKHRTTILLCKELVRLTNRLCSIASISTALPRIRARIQAPPKTHLSLVSMLPLTNAGCASTLETCLASDDWKALWQLRVLDSCSVTLLLCYCLFSHPSDVLRTYYLPDSDCIWVPDHSCLLLRHSPFLPTPDEVN